MEFASYQQARIAINKFDGAMTKGELASPAGAQLTVRRPNHFDPTFASSSSSASRRSTRCSNWRVTLAAYVWIGTCAWCSQRCSEWTKRVSCCENELAF